VQTDDYETKLGQNWTIWYV